MAAREHAESMDRANHWYHELNFLSAALRERPDALTRHPRLLPEDVLLFLLESGVDWQALAQGMQIAGRRWHHAHPPTHEELVQQVRDMMNIQTVAGGSGPAAAAWAEEQRRHPEQFGYQGPTGPTGGDWQSRQFFVPGPQGPDGIQGPTADASASGAWYDPTLGSSDGMAVGPVGPQSVQEPTVCIPDPMERTRVIQL